MNSVPKIDAGSFSIALTNGIYLDYNWLKPEWTRSEKEGSQWFPLGAMKSEDVPELLKKFGLSEIFAKARRQPTLARLRTMSPADLIEIRRAWERRNKKPSLRVVSDLNGGRIRAEDVARPNRAQRAA